MTRGGTQAGPGDPMAMNKFAMVRERHAEQELDKTTFGAMQRTKNKYLTCNTLHIKLVWI